MKILKNKKALSPVIAAIILIAVTVAVSIAVAAWMGALTFTFMSSGEQLQVGNPWGWGNNTGTANYDYVYVNVTNNGGSTVVLTSARVGNDVATLEANSGSLTLSPGDSAGLKITLTDEFASGVPYTITIVTQSNHEFQTIGTPPGT